MGVSVDTGGGGGRKSVDAEINLVPFIDMMSCLVAFLLLTAVWTNVAQMKVDSKKGVTSNTDAPDTPQDQECRVSCNVSVLVTPESIWVGYGTRDSGAVDTREIKKKSDTEYDLDALSAVLNEYKKGDFADRKDIEVAGEEKVSYDDLVKTVDAAIGSNFTDVGVIPPGSLTLRFKQ